MLKRIVTYSVSGMLVFFIAITIVGIAVKKLNAGRIAPGVMLCGQDVSGMTTEEIEKTVAKLSPETVTEIHCRFLPEMREKVTERVNVSNRTSGETKTAERRLTIQENELCLTGTAPLFRVRTEDTVQSVIENSNEVKVWEWLYEAVFGRPFRVRQAEAVFAWEEEQFGTYVTELRKIAERDRKEATVGWEKGRVKVTESVRGFRLETETLWEEAETVVQEAIGRMKEGTVEGLVLRFYVKGTALMPRLTTEQAANCNTVIGTFATSYAGAGGGRAQNIEAGAKKLHTDVILPGETYSVAAVLMPFTEENGYAAGGTYIDGQLAESIGGGVCQLSTTLYNALLQTRLDITMRYPHSMPVGYISLGRDAAIAGDYKDLRFVNTTKAPVLLLCEATGEEVKVTLYGTAEAKREHVTFESVVTEEGKDSVTVEVYRIETRKNEEEKRERVSRDKYRQWK